MVVPFYCPSGLNVTMTLVALLLGLRLLDMVVRQRQIWLTPSAAGPFTHELTDCRVWVDW